MTTPETPGTPLRLTPEQIDAIEVTDAIVLDDRSERFALDLGPIRFEATTDNSGRVADALIRLADRIVEASVDAYDDFRIRTGHKCVCGTWLDKDDPSCGDLRCEHELGLVGSS